MKNKFISAVALCLVGGIVLTGCNANNVAEAKISSEGKKAIREATLETGTVKNYIIQNLYEAPDGNQSFLEVVTDGSSYTELPVGNQEEGEEKEAGNVSYMMSDWLDKSGEYTMVVTDSEGKPQEYSVPAKFGKKMKSRNIGYLDLMVEDFTSIKELGTKKGNIGEGEEEYTLYECTLPSETVREILGMDTEGIYKFYSEAKDTNKNVKKLCEYYLDEYDMSLTFSDAIVTVSIADGKLRQMTMEIGGLGTKMFITKTFILNSDFDVREKPDFSDSKDFADSLKDVADFVSKYDSYEEAMEAMTGATSKQEVTESAESKTEETEKAE